MRTPVLPQFPQRKTGAGVGSASAVVATVAVGTIGGGVVTIAETGADGFADWLTPQCRQNGSVATTPAVNRVQGRRGHTKRFSYCV